MSANAVFPSLPIPDLGSLQRGHADLVETHALTQRYLKVRDNSRVDGAHVRHPLDDIDLWFFSKAGKDGAGLVNRWVADDQRDRLRVFLPERRNQLIRLNGVERGERPLVGTGNRELMELRDDLIASLLGNFAQLRQLVFDLL